MDGKVMLDKWKANGPYYFFFYIIPKSPDTLEEKNSIQFTDLLCPSLGKLKCTLQLTSSVDINWLMEQYKTKNADSLPLTLVYTYLKDDNEKQIEENFKQITLHKMNLQVEEHHSKIGLFLYDDDSDSLRVVVSTADMWESIISYNSGLWLSPLCPLMNDDTKNNGESPTGFKSDLLNYLRTYNISCLKSWIRCVEKADFSDIRVFLVSSTPGLHHPYSRGCHRFSMANLLQKHCHLPPQMSRLDHKKWKVIAQAASLGKFGDTFEEWAQPVVECLTKSKTLSSTRCAEFNLVYPTEHNVTNGYSGPNPNYNKYNKKLDNEQRWFREYMHQWKADHLNRSRALPRIRSYTRVSPCLTKLAYYLLTTANFTKSSWGSRVRRDRSVYVRAYEAGVLFLPEIFDEEYLEIKESPTNKNRNLFPFMFDLPLTPYDCNDNPWCFTV